MSDELRAAENLRRFSIVNAQIADPLATLLEALSDTSLLHDVSGDIDDLECIDDCDGCAIENATRAVAQAVNGGAS